MIKEYFTDGLIGLAILLSLFRTDLVGINNLINYPEVQDIILGQSVAYLPASYNHILNSPRAFESSKHLDFNNEAFTAWYQNWNNIPLFRERNENEIEAFLVSSPQLVFDHSPSSSQTAFTIASVENNHVAELSTQNLPEESANDFSGVLNSTSVLNNSSEASAAVSEPVFVDSSVVLLNNPFPGCNLTKEDLDLIDVLWQQDVDLGVGKEVYDPNLRFELEKERENELIKHQEWQKSQLLVKEKAEREKHEQADKWLKEHFRRDGETGEWVRLQNGTSSSFDCPETDDSLTLEAALDFLSSNVDQTFLQNLEAPQESIANTCNGFLDTPFQTVQEEQIQTLLQQPQELLNQQDSLDENWNGIFDYLNNAANVLVEDPTSTLSQLGMDFNASEDLASGLDLGQEDTPQRDFLIQNVTLMQPVINSFIFFVTLFQFVYLEVLQAANEINSTLSSSNLNNSVNFELGSLSFLNSMSTMQSQEDLDIVDVQDLFRDMQGSDEVSLMDSNIAMNESMDAFTVLDDNLSQSVGSLGRISPYNDLNETFDGLEGATGGTNYSASQDNFNGRNSKVSRLSESSNDSGFAYQGGFSSSSSTSSSAGSPAGCHMGGNISTSSNDTEQDPHGTRAVTHHHVAHNHTYNTPPGQIPREVKKYAQKEPSRKGPQSRDQRRAEELKIPFTIDEIIESPVETFNEILMSHKLNEAQLALVRDIRRRGKNKVAAQNCRKRKVGVIVSLSDEMIDLQKARDRLVAERAEMEKETRKIKEKFGGLYTHIFQSLRDERGEPYDPNLYSLQQSSDGNVFLVPRNISVGSKYSNSSSASSSPTSSKDSVSSKKRKSFDE
ncbi:unnamed protein product [Lymnaea stagnalis]|uniref:BZIP domain-containing protein n=1 Tax=Lymnaea stagnalis TaxID=6523 RepID=A0AAV2HLR3_LYMST